MQNEVIDLQSGKIASFKIEGLNKRNKSVRQLIIRVSDQLKAGEINLIETTGEDAHAARRGERRLRGGGGEYSEPA